MAVRLSVGAANAKWAGLAAQWAGCFAAVFEGTQPATPETAATGTKLATITLDNDGTTGLTWDTPADAQLAKPDTDVWAGSGLAAGTAGYIRFYSAGDDPATTGATTDERIDMVVTRTGSSECIVSTTSVALGQTFTINSATLEEPVT